MDLNTLEQTMPWDWPGDAGKTLIGIITSRQAVEQDRLLAIELAGDPVVIGDDVAGTLLQVVGAADESEAMRGAAAISLGTILAEADMLDGDVFGDEEDYITPEMLAKIQHDFKAFFHDAGTPERVRRMILEASVRAPADWHPGTVRSAYQADDALWRLTAVFCMQYLPGFDKQILEAIESDDDLIHYHAVVAAGNWELKGAWRHIVHLLTAADTDKELLLAAIEAVVNLDFKQAPLALQDLLASEDEDIVDAVHEALSMIAGLSEPEDFDDA
ncbi:MAG: hypothetical protein GY697_11710 [Desulfobacterales bacterium]|nr:hypothetical protein [Desulfobacterales bacterium]